MPVHPRMCGADAAVARVHYLNSGSPPHVRGRRESLEPIHLSRRFTPACAGQTPAFAGYFAGSAVHPRMCGADGRGLAFLHKHPGSPPHVRGRPQVHDGFVRLYRFTPACAGQTGFGSPCISKWPVHPRMCGADAFRSPAALLRAGSPPHVRGRPCPLVAGSVVSRFTPACAGQTQVPRLRHPHQPVHPRMCGADRSQSGAGRFRRGSPPHVRGRRRPCLRLVPRSAVHPRMCGTDGR